MYYISDDFLTAIQSKKRESNITGSIILNDGTTIKIDNNNIVSGSFSIDKSCTDGDDVKLGSAYVAELRISIYTDIDRYKLYNSIIKLDYNLKTKTENGIDIYESAPLGIFTINEANRTGKQVAIVAYDNMIQLDTPFSEIRSGVTPYELLSLISNNTRVELAQSKDEIDNMCKRDEIGEVIKIGIKNNSDIKTYRDLLYYIAQFLGGFATIDNLGRLKINHYHKSEDIVIHDSIRSSSSFSDYYYEVTGLTIPIDGNITKQEKNNEIKRNVELLKSQIVLADAEYAEMLENVNAEEAQKTEEIMQQKLPESEEKEALRILAIQYNNIRKMLTQAHDESVQAYKNQIDNLNKQLQSDTNIITLFIGSADGVVLELEENPLLFYGTLETKRKLVENIAEKIIGLTYTPCTIKMLENPIIELGDAIKCDGYNTPASGVWSVITNSTFRYRSGQTLTACGKNIKLINNKIQTETDRQNAATSQQAAQAALGNISYKNTNTVNVDDTKDLLAIMDLSLHQDTVPLCHGQANLNVTVPGRFKVTYELNGTIHNNYTINYFDVGLHTMTLFDVLTEATATRTNKYNIFIQSVVDDDGNFGEAIVEKDNVLIALTGSYINQHPDFDGNLTLYDTDSFVHGVNTLKASDDEFNLTWITQVGPTLEDEVNKFKNKTRLKPLTDEIHIELIPVE